MSLLIFFAFISIFVSFLCSILEAVLLSVSPTFITIKKKEGKVMADQIMTVSKKRVYKKIGVLTEIEMVGVERILKLQLGLKY